MTFLSYAQNFEDVMLWRAFRDVAAGRYIDIGAQDPVEDSVSRWFYENGWRGIHVEPHREYAKRLRLDRPDEIVIEAAIGSGPPRIPFYYVDETGLSTGNSEIAAQHRNSGLSVEETEVALISLDSLLEDYGGGDIHWMKIDVEGMEAAVIDSWKVGSCRPWVVVVESTLPRTPTPALEYETALLDKGYTFVYFDGLNRFYVSQDKPHLLAYFNRGPNVFDGFALSGQSTSQWAEYLNGKIESGRTEIESLNQELQDTRSALSSSQTEVAGKASELLAAEKLNADRLANLEKLNDTNAALMHQNTILKDDIHLAQKRLTKTLRKLERASGSLAAIEHSRWWRLGRPIRALRRLFR